MRDVQFTTQKSILQTLHVLLVSLRLLKRDLLKNYYNKFERNEFMKLDEYFLFRFRILIKQLTFHKDNKFILFVNSRHICCGQSGVERSKKRWVVEWRLGGLPFSVVGVRALALFCYLWIVVWSKLNFDESKEKRRKLFCDWICWNAENV